MRFCLQSRGPLQPRTFLFLGVRSLRTVGQELNPNIQPWLPSLSSLGCLRTGAERVPTLEAYVRVTSTTSWDAPTEISETTIRTMEEQLIE